MKKTYQLFLRLYFVFSTTFIIWHTQALSQKLNLKRVELSQTLSELDEALEKLRSRQYQITLKAQDAQQNSNKINQLLYETQHQLEQLKFKINKQLRKYFIDKNLGVLPVLVGNESIDGFILRRYIMNRIALQNKTLFNELSEKIAFYEKQKKEALFIAQKLEEYRKSLKKQADLVADVKQERQIAIQKIIEERAFTEKEIKLITKRHETLSELIGGLNTNSPQKLNSLSILNAKGLLEWPVKGEINYSYSPNAVNGFLVPLYGAFILAAFKDPVRSVFDGKVVFAGFMRNFGKTIVLDHGNSIHTVYAHLEQFSVTFGNNISRGQKIGTLGDPNQNKNARLYFEVRQNGMPQDPAKWLR